MLFKAIGDKIITSPIKKKDKTPGGIVLPNAARQFEKVGKVLSVGPDVEGVKPCDLIMFPPELSVELTYKGESAVVVTACNVFAVIGKK